MANQITSYICPSCTGPLKFSGNSGKMECEYCGSSFTVEEIEEKYKAADEKAVEAKQHAEEMLAKDSDLSQTQKELYGEGMKVYSCPSCGGELVCDENVAASCCPYCSNPSIIPGQFSGMLKPEFVIPFKYEKKYALDALKQHYGSRFFLPSSFKNSNHLEEVKGIYVPFWLYDGSVAGGCVYEGTKRHTRREGNEEVTITEYYSLQRRGHLSFDKIPADASKNMPDDLMDSVEPFVFNDLKPFAKGYLSGYLADKYDVNEEENAARAKKRAIGSIKSFLRRDIVGYDTVSELSNDIQVNVSKVSYALLPVWLLNTKWNGQNFKFAMNGQTGKIVGDLPLDKTKFTVTLMVIFGVVAACCMGFAEIEFMYSALIALVIVAIAGWAIYSSMKSVGFATSADDYVLSGTAEIEFRTDTFVRRSESRRLIENKNNNN